MSRWLPMAMVWGVGVGILAAVPLLAQGTRPRPGTSPPSATALRSLESKTQEARDAYLTQLSDLAKGYEESGDIERAQETLQQILRITPDDAKIKARLTDLRNKVFDSNQKIIEVDSTKGWVSTGLRVAKGAAIRLRAEGSYKFIVNTDVGPDGFPTRNVMQDMGAGVNCGALMGVVVGDPTPRNRSPQPGDPFQIGTELEYKPDADGVLFVRLNVPPASKCIGKVKLMIAGNFTAVGG